MPLVSICIVSELPPPPGGIAVQAQLLSDNLRRQGHIVYLARTNPLSYSSRLRRLKWIRGALNFALFLPLLFAASFKADCVHVLSNSYLSFFLFTFPAVTLGKLLRKRVVLHYHGGAAEQFLQSWFWLARPALVSADKVVVPSKFLSSVFRNFNIETEEVPNILELSSFPFRPRVPLRPRVIIARHLEPAYNVACGIRAFSIFKSTFPDAFLTIAGDGSCKASLLALCADLGINDSVRFMGNVANDQMHVLYDQADVYLNSSRVDNQPVSILEAFACGLPVVTTAVGGIPYMVNNREDALLAPNDDPTELAAQMTMLLSHPELADRLIRNAHARIWEHSWDNVYRKHKAIYLERMSP
jgi:glycosyltransferase involved in cell wall biosynthesis